jgi:GTP-binding protein EngB required for normal cell division
VDQFALFSEGKQRVLQKLEGLQEILEAIQAQGVDTVADVEKVGHAKQSIVSDTLRIALLGAFSDGKTSVVAAWLGKILADMKIDMDESSDQLAFYRPEGLPGSCEIVDTPGLFGDKEIDAAGRKVMYGEVTKRYISEAHLVLYVVDATNPLKDSHSEIVQWLLRDLGKLNSTIFVINKMDEVCDLKDPVSFEQQVEIKQKNLKEKLGRAASLSAQQLAQLHVVCVAANPNGRGLPFWFARAGDYESRSRIPALKATTARVLSSSVPEVLQSKTGMDVVRELVREKLAKLAEHQAMLGQGQTQTSQEIERVEEDLAQGRRDVLRHAEGLSRELDALDKELMAKLRPLELQDLRVFLEDEIGLVEGAVGAKLQRRIKSLVDKYAEQSAEVVNKVAKDIARQIENTSSFLASISAPAGSAASHGLKGLQAMDPSVVKSAILVTRDLLSGLGVAIKFKPWEVTKLAGNLVKWAGPAGAVLQVGGDLYAQYQKSELEKTLSDAKSSIGKEVQSATQNVRQHLASDAAIFSFLSPQLQEFEQVLRTLRGELEKINAGQLAVRGLDERLQQLISG